jgi:hypothetical protein
VLEDGILGSCVAFPVFIFVLLSFDVNVDIYILSVYYVFHNVD